MPEALAPAPTQTFNAPQTAPPTPAPPDDGPSMFDSLDALAGVAPEKPKDKPTEPAKEPKKEAPKDAPKDLKDAPKEQPKDAPKDKPQDKPQDKAKPDATPTTDKKPTAWEWGRQQERAAKEFKAKAEQLEKEIQQLKANPAKPVEDPEKITLAKRLAELEDEIRFTNYEKSSEFIEKYHRPYVEAYEAAKGNLMEMTVIDNKTGEPRQATENDFNAIISARTAEQAHEIASTLFDGSPAKAAYALQQREAIRQANKRAEQAKEEYRKLGIDREKQTHEQTAMQKAALRKEFEQHNEEAMKKLPEYFAPKEGDTEYNAKLEKGYQAVDSAFSGKGNPKLNSMIRMKAGSWDAQNLELKRTRAELKDALDKIREYEGSDPTAGSPAPAHTPKGDLSFDEQVDALARLGK